ncbi:MAG: hypothetical protein JWN40_5300 [Phycisphaerales bacterium]|nr:hypothetical protein [Phycisphaerales bacterium]
MRIFRNALIAAIVAVGIAGAATAAPLVNVKMLGSTNQAGPFSDTVTASAGQTVFYEMVVQLAQTGTTNGTKTINTRTAHPTATTAGYDGINSLSFSLLDDAANSVKVSFNADAALSTVTDAWNGAPGFSAGTRTSVGAGTNNRLTDVRPILAAGLYAGANADAIMLTGSFVVNAGSTGSSPIVGSFGSVNGGFSFNSDTSTGSNTLANKPTITVAGEPNYVSFAPLTVAVPEPGMIGLAAAAVVGLSFRRGRAEPSRR